MCLRQNIDFTRDSANRAVIAPVDAGLTCQNTTANDALLQALKDVLDVVLGRTTFSCQLSDNLILHLANALIALGFFSDAIGIAQRSRGRRFDRRNQLRVCLRRLPVPTWLTRLTDQLIDRVDDRLHLLVRIQHSTQHLVFGQLFCLRLDHEDRVFGASDHHIELTARQDGVARVQNVTVRFGKTDPCTANRAVKWTPRQRQCSRGTDHRRNIRISIFVSGHDRADHLHFIHEAVFEQWPNRAVNQSRGQGFLFARASFPLEKTAGDLTDRIRFLNVMH